MLERLLRDRLRKFMSLLLKVLAEDADDAVHDLRVWSRRLQQVVAALSSKPLPPQARTMVPDLRRARRKLANRKLFTLAHRAQKFLDELPEGERQEAGEVLASSVADGHLQWR